MHTCLAMVGLRAAGMYQRVVEVEDQEMAVL